MKVKRKIGVTHFLRFLKGEVETIRVREGNLAGFYLRNQYGSHAVLDFAMERTGERIGWTDFGRSYKELQQSLPWKRYGQQYGEYDAAAKATLIRTSQLKLTDEIVRAMANSGAYFSITTLEHARELKKALIEKHKSIDASLDEILEAR
jgi:hypothetical protein